jgi:hypothetical protein
METTVKAKSTSDSPTALARHYKNIIAEQSAELARLTKERDAAIEDAREMTTRFDAVNSAACDVVDSYFGSNIDSEHEEELDARMKALREATVDDGRPDTTPPPADTGAGDPATENGVWAYTLEEKISHIDGNFKNWQGAPRATRDNILGYVLNDITDALQMISEQLTTKGERTS